MKILITGGLGFIGSNFILNQYKNTNNKIVNIDLVTYAANPHNLNSIESSPRYNFVKGDIQDEKLIAKVVKESSPDVLINFAAESHVDRSIDSPHSFVETNIFGTYALLNVCLDYYKVSRSDFKFIQVSTDEVYGSLGKKGLFTEKTPFSPNSPYSASKASSDLLVRAWYKTYGLPVVTTHCSNNFGPMQFPEKLIPLVIMKCLKEEPIPIYGNGQNIRDWIYVNDHCEALNAVLKDGKAGETYNIGGNKELSNIDLVKQICHIMDKKTNTKNIDSYVDLISFVKDRPGHDYRYAVDITKIKEELDWAPTTDFQLALSKTIDWYLDNIEWCKFSKNFYDQTRLGSSA